MAKTEFLFSQKYRPNRIADLILSEDIKETLQSFVDQKDLPNFIFHSNMAPNNLTVHLQVDCAFNGLTALNFFIV